MNLSGQKPAPKEGGDNEFNFAAIAGFLYLHRIKLVVITLVAGVLGFIFSLPYFIHPKYLSTMVFYPSTTSSISKAIMSTSNASNQDVLALGREDEAEQLLQFLQSDEITSKICKKYHLMRHYRINPDSKYPNTKLAERFSDNIKYRRTEYMSVEVAVLDEDKDTAAMIANDIGSLLDSAKGRVLQERAKAAFEIVKYKFEDRQRYLQYMVDSLKHLGYKGVLNYTDQASQLQQDIDLAVSSGKLDKVASLEKNMDTLAKYGPAYDALENELKYEIGNLAELKIKYEEAKLDAEQMLPAKFVINYASPAEKKAYPDRILIILVSMGFAFAISVIILALIDNYKKPREIQKVPSRNEELGNA